MSYQPLTSQQIQTLVGTRHGATGLAYPPLGLQPYYDWLIQSLHLLAESSLAAFRVAQDDADALSVRIAPGRCTISAAVLDFPGQTLDLGAYDDDTALIWLDSDLGVPTVGHDTQAAGWPTGDHLKLAEVTCASGAISSILDRRLETVFRV